MQLELVLLLHRERDRCWSAAAAARELRAPEQWLEDQLQALLARGVAATSSQEEGCYRLDVAGPMAPTIDEIALRYPQWRTSMVALIHRARPADLHG